MPGYGRRRGALRQYPFLSSYPRILEGLQRRYTEAGRFYHTWDHIDFLIERFVDIKGLIRNPRVVLLAIYYHDAVYNAGSEQNEDRSAELLVDELATVVDAQTLTGAAGLIRATAVHAIPESMHESLRQDCAVFLDMDLSILGASPSVYADYARNIRREYGMYGEAAYRSGRTRVLKGFLEKDQVFFTDYFRDLLEAQAVANLERELTALQDKQIG